MKRWNIRAGYLGENRPCEGIACPESASQRNRMFSDGGIALTVNAAIALSFARAGPAHSAQ